VLVDLRDNMVFGIGLRVTGIGYHPKWWSRWERRIYHAQNELGTVVNWWAC